jgi:hypothetical protein
VDHLRVEAGDRVPLLVDRLLEQGQTCAGAVERDPQRQRQEERNGQNHQAEQDEFHAGPPPGMPAGYDAMLAIPAVAGLMGTGRDMKNCVPGAAQTRGLRNWTGDHSFGGAPPSSRASEMRHDLEWTVLVIAGSVKIPTSKFQIPTHSQPPTSNFTNRLAIEAWECIGAWDLELGI